MHHNSNKICFHFPYSRDPDVLRQLPDGLLAIDSFWLGGVHDFMATSLERVLEAVTCLLLSQSNSVPYSDNNGNDWLNNLTGTNGQSTGSQRSSFNSVHNGHLSNLDYLKASSINSSNSSNSSSTNNIPFASLRSTSDFVDTFRR